MSNTIPLEHGSFYHIYNRGVNGEELFRENDNYEYFLQLYDKYIDLIADTFAWALLNNHFHFLVRIKEEEEIEYLPPKLLNPDRSGDPVRFKNDADPSGSSRPDGVLYTKRKPIKSYTYENTIYYSSNYLFIYCLTIICTIIFPD